MLKVQQKKHMRLSSKGHGDVEGGRRVLRTGTREDPDTSGLRLEEECKRQEPGERYGGRLRVDESGARVKTP